MAQNTNTPEALKDGAMRVVALGGLGEVGRNMTVFEIAGHLLIVDCGVLFPEEIQPGVDLILPDFSYLEGRYQKIDALVLTHGHEDHIGAVPYLLRHRPDIPIYGSALTIAFLEPKLNEHGFKNPHLNVVKEGQCTDLGLFNLEYVAVNHSIPDALAVMVRTEAGNALITGDFKMDQLPLDRRITDLRSFARLGTQGVDLFLVDSTNAEVPGFVTSEREIGPVLEDVFMRSSGQIVCASFASHVHRVQQILDAADAAGRKVQLVGRSMERNMRIANEKGYLHFPPDIVVDQAEMSRLPDDQRVYMATGSQGEPMAALARIAAGEHRSIEIGVGDTVVFASSLIPGNENSVNRVINQLTRRGVNVVHQGKARVHVSGHAASGELLYCYNIVKPKNVMPIHGEIRHLVANGKLAVQTGIDPKRVILAEDGTIVDLKDGKASIAGQVECNYVYVDGSSIGQIGESELYDRRVLGEEGFIAVYAVMEMSTGTILSGPTITARGVAEESYVYDEVIPEIAQVLADKSRSGKANVEELQQVMRRTLGRWVSRRLRRRPMIVPLIVEA